MIVPDLNLLLYAHIDGFDRHAEARGWWENVLSGDDMVGIPPVVAMGFVRLATSSRLTERPMRVPAASAVVRSWLDQPHVRLLSSDRRHVEESLDLLAGSGAGGNLTTDAQIAAHATLEGATVASNDADFHRFDGLAVINPLAGSKRSAD
ncbi:TA system VapC family ribonuclease toxin [Georgenia sp. Z1344]|uniref:TA system VapC family ribonuclease toxin n=1 Tax=Georgenia sp. Z1344 TaxID=3416706 RepID=UPI003CF4D298